MERFSSILIIWCDISFATDQSYTPMKDEFIAAARATSIEELRVSQSIIDEASEQFRSNAAPLITVTNVDDALKLIKRNQDKKIFVISSGSVGRCLVPKIRDQYHQVLDFYIFAHNINLHMDWVDQYLDYVNLFDHPTDVLIRLTRDISNYFIKQGEWFLEVDAPTDAKECFIHARNLEECANQRDKMDKNVDRQGIASAYIEFRENLNRLEGDEGLIATAERKIHELECTSTS